MIDLHVHTKISDGSLTITEIVKLAKVKGIRHLAITDNDTTKGLREAAKIGIQTGVNIIPGIEISAYDYKKNRRAHIIGLYVQPGHMALETICNPLIEARHEASIKMFKKIIDAGYNIEWEDVEHYSEGGTGVYEQHIMHALLDKGYCRGIYDKLYRILFQKPDEKRAQGIAYVPIEYIDVKKAIEAVRYAGGIAVIAHPGQMDNYDSIREWVEIGLHGIEVYHPRHDKDDINKSLELAKKFNLVVTGGSDFHGFYAESPVDIGCKDLQYNYILELENAYKKRLCSGLY